MTNWYTLNDTNDLLYVFLPVLCDKMGKFLGGHVEFDEFEMMVESQMFNDGPSQFTMDEWYENDKTWRYVLI